MINEIKHVPCTEHLYFVEKNPDGPHAYRIVGWEIENGTWHPVIDQFGVAERVMVYEHKEHCILAPEDMSEHLRAAVTAYLNTCNNLRRFRG